MTCATADERTVLGGLVPSTPAAAGCGRTVIAAKNNHGRDIESALPQRDSFSRARWRRGETPALTELLKP